MNPERRVESIDPASMLISYEEVSFPSVDGTPLAGWFVPGKRAGRTLILCHDLGEDRSYLLNTAIPLRKASYNLFLFDFRGHGKSGGSCSLGLQEKRDILGAIDYLSSRPDVDKNRFGFVGIGMGAHAGILAARDRKELKALVLDSPYPNVKTLLARSLSSGGSVERYLAPLPLLMFDLRFRASAEGESAEKLLPQLADRNILFIVAREDEHAPEVHRMYEAAHEGRVGDKNLLELAGSRAGGLYAQDKTVYDETLLRFFERYLPEAPPRRDILHAPAARGRTLR